ncbi:hypothetical protein [Consotaella aegiceratis]|uniref:hypothetical protein n=1 Tax=Consotaella aegiceratis TaxID=3097961 RepID=UPI002F3F9429
MAALIGLVLTQPVLAQNIPTPSFIERGLRSFQDDKPGGNRAYASPSAIPGDLVPDAGSVGAAPTGALRQFDPIALPEAPMQPYVPDLDLPNLPAYAPQQVPTLRNHAPRTIAFEARLTEDGDTIPDGVVWRLFSPIPGGDGRLPLIASATGGSSSFDIPPGSYILYAAYGRAGVTKRVNFTGLQTREVVVFDAGGLKLNASLGNDEPIADNLLSFDIYSSAENERDRQLIVADVEPGRTIRLNAGTYQIVSKYGSDNAVIRADIRVEPGKLTTATIQHHAAQLTFKLVRDAGGEALADTAWSVSSMSGDVIRESVGAFATMVLAEGDYVVVAKNKDRLYQREFEVESGKNAEVEVLTSDLLAAAGSDEGSGD